AAASIGVLLGHSLGTGRALVTLGAGRTLGPLLRPVARFALGAWARSVRGPTHTLFGARLVLRSAFAVALARARCPPRLLPTALAERALRPATMPTIPLTAQCFVLRGARFDLDWLHGCLRLRSQPTEDLLQD